MTTTRSVLHLARRFARLAQRAVAVAALFTLAWASAPAWATGSVGPVGPVGPIGPLGPGKGGVEPDVPRPGRPLPVPRPAAPPKPKASTAGTGNRIEVSGNTASGTRCAGDGTASVNSVDVAGAQLEGRTVIVQGRNANNVRTVDCPERTEGAAPSPGAPGQLRQPSQTNSVRIR